MLKETYDLIKGLKVTSQVLSDHYTNYIQVKGRLPEDKDVMLKSIDQSLKKDKNVFRKIYIGTE